MNGVLAIFQRELRAYFLSPLAYVVLCFLLVMNGIIFALILVALNDPLQPPGRPLDLFFGGTFLFWLVVLFAAPVLTMRLLAEERRSGSIEVLMTAPVTEGQVVLGKYLAALVFYAFLWLPTVTYAGIVALHSEIDWGVVAAGYLGVLLIGALFLAIGLFASALTSNQIIAAVMSFAILLGVTCLTFLEYFVNAPVAKEALAFISFPEHMSGEFAKGIVDTRRLVFYLAATGFFLFLTGRALESGKWR
ncbi:MAG TPA: ABC-2 transporter permease [Thermoanaerobaculia bacterium]|nr:ABC-2 transporter permease [Thermoanaerobaculia bacterium]